MTASEYFIGLELRDHPDIRHLVNRPVYKPVSAAEFDRTVERIIALGRSEGVELGQESVAELLCAVMNGERA